MKICLSCEGVTDATAQRCGHCGAWLLPTDAVHYPLRRGETDAGNPLIGTVVDGKYRLQSVLGRGGLGTVFRAQHLGSLMTVALKLLHPRFAERPEYRRALLPEARRAATVTHERCARLLDVGEAEEGAAYLAMELVDGRTLDVVARAGALPPAHAVAILAQIAEALVAIHDAGLVHCDLSPRNVMVASRSGQLRVKVLDFGIARSVSLAGDRTRGEFSGFVNPAFAAPELLAGRDVDPRADLYSFGTLAWLLLTGAMPVDDTDARRAAVAVAAGELRAWPRPRGVPARLGRLVQRCLRLDPKARPVDARAVLQELAIVQGARRPLLVRTSLAAAALAVVATIGSQRDSAAPFLQLLSGSELVLHGQALGASDAPQDLTSRKLATLVFHYGAFASGQLRADVARFGTVLLRAPLRPEVDAAAGTLLLSTAQADWRDVVQGLVRTSRDGPVDLAFVVSGQAPLGTARVRVDDEPPLLQVAWPEGERPLRAASRLQIDCRDDVEVARLDAVVRFADGERFELVLPSHSGSFAVGEAFARVAGLAARGAGEVLVRARDRAGNERVAPPLPFADADGGAPAVLAVTGPSGEAFAPALGDRLRLRVQLAGSEPGCSLRAWIGDAEATQEPLPEAASQVTLSVARPARRESFAGVQIEVRDAAGNRTDFATTIEVRDRTVQPTFRAARGAVRWIGQELVCEPSAIAVGADFGAAWRVASARFDEARDGDVRVVAGEAGAELQWSALAPGLHALSIELVEAVAGDALRTTHRVPLRVLAPIVMRVPATGARFLPALLQQGVLARRAGAVIDGPAWRFDPQLRPYVRGALHVGIAGELRLPVVAGAPNEPLFPEVSPVPGRNVLAVSLADVLDRPVRVLAGEGERSLDVVADFWWHDGSPEPIGEHVWVEHGQPATLRVRCPLPFAAGDLPELRLGIAQSELNATDVQPVRGDASVVAFAIPAAIWSVAAQLADRTREEFAQQLERRVDVHLVTPAGRHPLALMLRTTRSTLMPVTLRELGDVPEPLASVRLLPVLAPPGAFAEPVPDDAPPRATYRRQVAVAVRNMPDLLLQQGEFPVGAARLLVDAVPSLPEAALAACVHHHDPRGRQRLQRVHLLPEGLAAAAADAALVGVDFFQAYALSRLAGLVIAGDATAFRLPLGCELELAAFGGGTRAAAHGVAAHGRAVPTLAFLALGERFVDGVGPSLAAERAAGDVVPTAFGDDFVGLDFGVREWVGDLPYAVEDEPLLLEWTADHDRHLERVDALAAGALQPAPDPLSPQVQLAVVRGSAGGDRAGLVDRSGALLDAATVASVPANVPGVLRCEQLRRDGVDPFAGGRDIRLRTVGFRLATTASALLRLRGRR